MSRSEYGLFGRLENLLRSLFGLAPRGPRAEAGSTAASPLPAALAGEVPAVAGFLQRWVPPPDMMLPERLSTVARLNTPAGRKPHRTGGRIPANSKPMPSAARGAKRLRPDAGPGRRIRPLALIDATAPEAMVTACAPVEPTGTPDTTVAAIPEANLPLAAATAEIVPLVLTVDDFHLPLEETALAA